MQFEHIHYHAKRNVFRAQVSIAAEQGHVTFPCEVAADPTMRPAGVMALLARRASKILDS